jgi:hypothetical protein
MEQRSNSLPNIPPKIMGEVHSRQKVGSRKHSSTMGPSNHAMWPWYPALTPNGSTVLWKALRHRPKQIPGLRGSKYLRDQLQLTGYCPTTSYGEELHSSATFFKTASTAQDRPRDKSGASKVIPEAYPEYWLSSPRAGTTPLSHSEDNSWLLG